MSAQLVELEGTLMWSKLFERNKDRNEDFHGPGGAYTQQIILEKGELDKYTKSGGRVKPRMVDEGVALQFRRRHIDPNGIEDFSGPPKVADANLEPWDDSVNIGNGSKGKVWVEVYDTKQGKGTRLKGVQVTDLVEYETDTEGSTDLPF